MGFVVKIYLTNQITILIVISVQFDEDVGSFFPNAPIHCPILSIRGFAVNYNVQYAQRISLRRQHCN